MKGNVFDTLFGIVSVLVIAVSVLLGAYIYGSFKSAINPVADSYTNERIDKFNGSFGVMANIVPIFLIAILSIGVIAALMIDTHPVFFIVSMFGYFIILLLSPYITDIYWGFATTDKLSSFANQFSLMTMVMENLPMIALIFGGLTLIALYAKWRGYV